MKPVWIIAVALVVVMLLTVTWVGSNELAVREAIGGDAVVLDTGLHLRVFPYHRIYRYSRQSHRLDDSLEILSRDNATFGLPVTIAARVSAGDLLTFHRECSGRESDAFIDESIRGAIAVAARAMNADSLLNPRFAAQLSQAVSAALIERGISDDGLRIGSIRPQVVFNAVLDYLNRNFTASARALAEGAIAEDDAEPYYQAALGAVLEAEGKPAEAEKSYLDALFLNPAAPEPMSRLYLMYQSQSDPETLERLERLLSAAIEKNPDSPVHHDWLGQLNMRFGRLDHSEAHFNRAIELAPKTPQFHVSLGSLRARQGLIPDARAEYEEALKIQPDHPLALFNVGSTYAMEGDLKRAVGYFERAAAGPPNHAILNSLAQAYEGLGRDQEAAELLRRSLALRTDQPDRRAALQRLEAKLKSQR